MKSTTSTTITGAILSAIADLFLILVIGWDSFAPERQEHYSGERCLERIRVWCTTSAAVSCS